MQSRPQICGGLLPVTWGSKVLVKREVFDEVIRMLFDIQVGTEPLESFAHRYGDAHKTLVEARFSLLPRMLIRIDLPTEGIDLDMEVVRNAMHALQDDLRPGC